MQIFNFKMNSVIASILLIPAINTDIAFAKDPIVSAFIKLTEESNISNAPFINALNNYKSFAQMKEEKIIQSAYDCLPEFRIECFKTLNRLRPNKEEYIVQEWGEWQDGIRDERNLKEFVYGHFTEANRLGFNLFKPEEVRSENDSIYYRGYDHTLGAFDEVPNLKIISVIGELEDKCRGSSTELTWAWCGVRQIAYDFIINKRNVCHGTNNQATFEYKWHKCTKNSNR